MALSCVAVESGLRFSECPGLAHYLWRRTDAIAELDRCAAKGARVLKIHPPIQGVDLLEQRHARFFRRCAELKIVVTVHTGHEHSAPIVSAALADPRKAALALEEGCTVVACHCGSG